MKSSPSSRPPELDNDEARRFYIIASELEDLTRCQVGWPRHVVTRISAGAEAACHAVGDPTTTKVAVAGVAHACPPHASAPHWPWPWEMPVYINVDDDNE
jgi:hypothetical protein